MKDFPFPCLRWRKRGKKKKEEVFFIFFEG